VIGETVPEAEVTDGRRVRVGMTKEGVEGVEVVTVELEVVLRVCVCVMLSYV